LPKQFQHDKIFYDFIFISLCHVLMIRILFLKVKLLYFLNRLILTLGGDLLSGKPSRDKGARVEREIVNTLKEHGVYAERVPLSGAAGGSYTGDVRFGKSCANWVGEVKARKDGSGFKTLDRWLGDNDALFLKKNNADVMVVLPFDRFLELMRDDTDS
jgi:hypothetical protein